MADVSLGCGRSRLCPRGPRQGAAGQRQSQGEVQLSGDDGAQDPADRVAPGAVGPPTTPASSTTRWSGSRAAPARGRGPVASLLRARTRGPGRTPGGRRPRDAGHRRHLHRLRGLDRRRPALAVRHHPPHDDLATSGTWSSRAWSSGSTPSTCSSTTCYHDQRSVSAGVVPSELVGGLPQLPPGVCRGGSARGDLGPHLRERPHPRRRRDRLRAGGQPAGAVRGLLPAGEPDGGQARLPRDVPPLQHRARRPLRRPAGQHAGLRVPVHR